MIVLKYKAYGAQPAGKREWKSPGPKDKEPWMKAAEL
jgi:hypothetical protein